MLKTVIAAALIAAAAIPALANDHAWQVGNDSMHLYYNDLDMNSVAGRAALLARVERAADRLCRDRTDRTDCVAATVRATPAPALKIALAERDGVRVAAR